jgi:hypothetical protein
MPVVHWSLPEFDPKTWGTAAQWISAVGTVATLAALARSVRNDRRDRLEEHARQLVVWWSPERTELMVSNISPYPFTSVWVEFVGFNYRAANSNMNRKFQTLLPELPPNAAPVIVPHVIAEDDDLKDKPWSWEYNVVLTDHHGRTWEKSERGNLVRGEYRDPVRLRLKYFIRRRSRRRSRIDRLRDRRWVAAREIVRGRRRRF